MKNSVIFCFLLSLIANFAYGNQFRAILEPKEHTLLASEVTSTVTNISKEMGQDFEKGQTLISLDKTIYLANYKKAKAILSKAEAELDAMRQLYEDKVISHAKLRQSKADLATAEAELVYALKAYESCDVKAPYSGKVVNVYVKEFERVQPGQNLIEIIDDHILIAKLLLPDRYLNYLKINDEIDMRIRETGTQYRAKIIRIGAVVDPVSSLFKVDAEIDNKNNDLLSGMEGVFITHDQEQGIP